MQQHVSPTPSDEEAVAIAAAVEALWPRAVAVTDSASERRRTAWRFSGRWWAQPIVSRRGRPW